MIRKEVADETDVALVVQLLVERLGALGVVAGEHPVTGALGDQRGLEIAVRGHAAVADGLRELERPLGVLARGLEVALAAMAA